MNPLYKRCLLRMLLFLGYAHLFGWLFSLMEKREESNTVVANRWLENLRIEMKNKYNISKSTDFYKFVEEAHKASKVMQKTDWSFISGCSFAMSAMTTVGYGDITPETELGQALTIPFCLIGLPITMLALKTSGEVLLVILTRFQVCFERRILRKKNPKTTFLKSFFIVAFAITSLMCLLATGSVYYHRDWTFIEAVYCWFITFTTIGFGDYVPIYINNEMVAQNMATNDAIYFIEMIISAMFVVPYIVGFCLISSLLNLLVDWSENINVNFKCCGMCDMRNHVKNRDKTFCISNNGTTLDHPMARNNSNDISLKSLSIRRFSY